MNPELFEIARSKTSDKAERQAIEELLFLARGIHAIETHMPSIITACKVMRGEKPPRYSKSKQQEIDEYGADVVEMEQEAIEDAKTKASAVDVVGPVYVGFKSDIDDNIAFLKYFKDGELQIAQVSISLKQSFISKMETYLPTYGGQTFIEFAEKFAERRKRK